MDISLADVIPSRVELLLYQSKLSESLLLGAERLTANRDACGFEVPVECAIDILGFCGTGNNPYGSQMC